MIIIYFSLFFSLRLTSTVAVSSVLHVMYILCNLNRVNNLVQYYVNRDSAVSSPNSVMLVFVL